MHCSCSCCAYQGGLSRCDQLLQLLSPAQGWGDRENILTTNMLLLFIEQPLGLLHLVLALLLALLIWLKSKNKYCARLLPLLLVLLYECMYVCRYAGIFAVGLRDLSLTCVARPVDSERSTLNAEGNQSKTGSKMAMATTTTTATVKLIDNLWRERDLPMATAIVMQLCTRPLSHSPSAPPQPHSLSTLHHNLTLTTLHLPPLPEHLTS